MKYVIGVKDMKKARRGEKNLSPVSSALFALPSSALLVQPYYHVEIITQNVLLFGQNKFMLKSIHVIFFLFTLVRLVAGPQ